MGRKERKHAVIAVIAAVILLAFFLNAAGAAVHLIAPDQVEGNAIVSQPDAEQNITSQGDFPGLEIRRNETSQTSSDLFQVYSQGEKRVWIDNLGELFAVNMTVENRENVSHLLGVSKLDFVTDEFDTEYKEGRLYYDSEADSLVSYIDNDQVSVNLGREMVIPVRNVEGTTLNSGDVVRITGSVGGSEEIEVMCANNTIADETDFLGVMTTDTANNEDGYMTIIGSVHSLDTSMFNSGDELYLGNTDCSYTTTPPVYPAYKKQIGIVSRSNQGNGVIDVDIDDEFNQGQQPGGIFFADTNGVIATDNNTLHYNTSNNTLKSENLTVKDTATYRGTELDKRYYRQRENYTINITCCSVSPSWNLDPSNDGTLFLKFNETRPVKAIITNFQQVGASQVLETTYTLNNSGELTNVGQTRISAGGLVSGDQSHTISTTIIVPENQTLIVNETFRQGTNANLIVGVVALPM